MVTDPQEQDSRKRQGQKVSALRLCSRAVRTATILALSRWAIAIAVAVFVLAMLLYPGGTIRDASTSGYDVFRNFGSDLGRTVALNGRPNRLSQALSGLGAVLLMVGIVASVAGVARVYSAAAPGRLWALTAVVAGLLATGSVLTAVLIPADVNSTLHVRFASFGFDVAPVVPLCFALATMRDTRFPIGVAFAWTLLTVVLAGFVFMRQPITTAAGLLIQVTAQKLVFVSIAGTLFYQSLQAGRVAEQRINR